MSGISPKLPLAKSSEDGYWGLTKTITEAIKQNLKNLILTIPGERVMMPSFGVGLKQYLFENQNAFVLEEVKARILQQTSIYMPSVIIEDIQTIDNPEQKILNGQHAVAIKILYRIEPLSFDDELDIEVEG
tara:strand:- start:124 stop:516 length:393 start_codon:yes stop_codon:yes gene_type:complete